MDNTTRERKKNVYAGDSEKSDSSNSGMRLPDHSPAVSRWMAKGGMTPRCSSGGMMQKAFGGRIEAHADNQTDPDIDSYDDDDEEDEYNFANGGMAAHPVIALAKAIRYRRNR